VGLQELILSGQKVTTWAVPAYFAAGWHNASALPGYGGNVVLNGHQSIYGGVFHNLTDLSDNDEIVLYAGDKAFRYYVTERHLLAEEGQPLAVRIQNAKWIMPTAAERLTLVTCAPDAQSTHRLIVVALPLAGPESATAVP
jgi:sortase A